MEYKGWTFTGFIAWNTNTTSVAASLEVSKTFDFDSGVQVAVEAGGFYSFGGVDAGWRVLSCCLVTDGGLLYFGM